MRVAELEGALLDFWVARACGHIASVHAEKNRCALWNPTGTAISDSFMGWFEPSTNGSDAVPIMQRDGIGVYPSVLVGWTAAMTPDNARLVEGYGLTLLIAAMRCKVASVYGDDVPDEVPA